MIFILAGSDPAFVVSQVYCPEEERLPEERQLGGQTDQLQVRGKIRVQIIISFRQPGIF